MSATTVEMQAIHVADLRAPRAWPFRPAGGRVLGLPALLTAAGGRITMPMLAWIIRHPAEGVILVDTGLHPDAVRRVRDDYGGMNGLVFGSMRPVDGDFAAQLGACGVEADAVTRVVMTHLHADHTSGMRLLPNARFTTTRAEWKAATHPRSELAGYAPKHLPGEDRMTLVDPAADGEPWEAFTRTLDLLGDGSVRLVATPGHTRGHVSVLVQRAEGPALIAGDAVYTLENLDRNILPFKTDDDDAVRRSMEEINAFRGDHRDAPVIPTHDPDAWRPFA